jgi:hypothetical protein
LADGRQARADHQFRRRQRAVRAAGGPAPTQVKFKTDHSYNDHRVALQTTVVDWLLSTFPDPRR